jgi:FkbM family methyltransferase
VTKVLINDQWELDLPPHRAARPEWKTGWERQRLDRMFQMIRPGDVVFDIGAEEGDMTGLYSLWGAEVVMVEPNPLVWPNIRWIWEANDLGHPWGWFAGFASDKTLLRPEKMEPIFAMSERNGWPAAAYGPLIGDHGFRVVTQRAHDTPQITLDDLAMKFGDPDVITLDCEGAEHLIMRGAREILTDVRPTIFMSVHERFLIDEYQDHPKFLWEFMDSMGYGFELLWWDHEAHVLWIPK